MYGFYGRILKIDLTGRQFEILPISGKILSRYIGGKGLGSFLLMEHNPEGIDPLSPGNHIIFATGPFTQSRIWGASRYGVFTKSPQTGFYSESYSGGRVPEAMDAAGFDAIVISGAGTAPTILSISPDGAVFHDAGKIWGMDTHAAETAINKRFRATTPKGIKSGSIVIGPAGESMVRFSVVQNDNGRFAGRTGAGAVMGSKKLKGIFFEGSRTRPIFDPEGLIGFAARIKAIGKNDARVLSFKTFGTSAMVEKTNKAGAFPTRYWSSGHLDGWEKIGSEALHSRCNITPVSCAKCFIACGRRTTIQHGRHEGLTVKGPEYETIFAFGGLCLIDTIEEIAYLNQICDRMGMDTISAGNLCGFAIEAFKKGRINYRINYGDVDAIAALLHMIAEKKGVGAVLAEGIKHAAETWDMESDAVHVKGLEPPGYDPRVLKGSGLAYAVSDRGACHLRATFHSPELTGLISPDKINGKVGLFIDYEDRLTLMDSFILCRFFRDLYPWDLFEEMFQIITGMKCSKTDLKEKSALTSSLVRSFNIREGLKPTDDNLPQRLYRKALKSGGRITEEELLSMVKAYYALKGWDENGVPAC